MYTAVSAAPPQYQVTQNRNIIIKSYPLFAGGTARWRSYNGFFKGYPVDTHVKKTAHSKAKNKGKYHLYTKWEHIFICN